MEFEKRYRYTVSVFFQRVKDSSMRDVYFHKCKVCGWLYGNAGEAKHHFNTMHPDELEKAAALGYIEYKLVRIRETGHFKCAKWTIGKHRDEILRKIDREDLLEVLK